MWHFLTHLFSTEGVFPRWECGAIWSVEPSLGWLHIISDVAIWGAYASIPLALLFFAYKRNDLPFSWMFVLFGAFILLCGTTHLLDAVMFYYPAYRLLGLVKILTALVSWATVIALIQILPLSLRLPGQARLAESLREEIARREASERHANEQERFIRDVLDSMSNQTAVVDAGGRVRLVNRAWQQFFPFETDDATVAANFQSDRSADVATTADEDESGDTRPHQFASIRFSRSSPPSGHPSVTANRSVAPHRLREVHYLDIMAGRVNADEILNAELELNRVLTGQATTATWEFLLLCDDLICLLATASPMPGGGGAVITHTDVTEQKRLLGDLKMARLDAEAANRAKSEFLANMSHEIRTPMAAILSSADVLYPLLNQPRQRELLQILRDQGQILLAIINDILDLSKIESGRMEIHTEPVNIVQLVTDLRSLMNVQAENRGIDLIADFPTSFPRTVSTDPLRLRQILLNLLSNAIKFTPKGEVTLRVSLFVADDRPETPLNRETSLSVDSYQVDPIPSSGHHLLFEVVDTGIGIPSQRLADIFEPFTQAHAPTSSQPGTGLGLAICRRLARMLGGAIQVRSAVGQGTTFSISIPVEASELAELIPLTQLNELLEGPDVRPVPADLAGLRILVAEDTRGLQFLIARLLESAQAEVTIVNNGQEAVDAILSPGLDADRTTATPEFDVILMDMQMPVLDGFSATRHLRAHGIDLPIIALTAGAMSGDRERCLVAGCSDYISKPFRKEEIIATIHRLISGSPRFDGAPSTTNPAESVES